MGWNGLERNRMDFILTDLLPVEISELFSFTPFYSFLLGKEQQVAIAKLVKILKTNKAKSDSIMFKHGWGTAPLKYNILKKTNSMREMSVIQPVSALNLFLFMECYEKDILHFFKEKHCFSIRYHKKNTNLYYKVKNKNITQYFHQQSSLVGKGAIQQTGNYFKIAPFESINAFSDSRIWRMCNFRYKYYAKIDYKSCFDSIYTHAYKWIIERNVVDSKSAKNTHMLLTIDRILQNINGLSSNGLVVGPEFSRMVAEVLLQQIDNEILHSLSSEGIMQNEEYAAFRYVDDIFIYANEQIVLDMVIEKYRFISEKYLLKLNDLKFSKGETPCLPKEWLGKTRHLSETISNLFYQGTRVSFDLLPEQSRFLIKSELVPVDRVKDEIAVLMKAYPDDRRTIVSFLLSTLYNNVSKKKNGYTLFRAGAIGRALLLLDLTFYIYAFFPSYDQTRKLISMIVYMNSEIDFKYDHRSKEKLRNLILRYSFIFQTGNLFDLCDWFPFLLEYNISLDVKTETKLIEKAIEHNDPILWGNIFLYSKYYEPFFEEMKAKISDILERNILNITEKEPMLHVEFWYVLVFHNCPYISDSLRNRMTTIINEMKTAAVQGQKTSDEKPSLSVTELVCDFLQLQSQNGKKPAESFFNWNGERNFSEKITYRTYQRTIFKRYRKNRYGLYASLD